MVNINIKLFCAFCQYYLHSPIYCAESCTVLTCPPAWRGPLPSQTGPAALLLAAVPLCVAVRCPNLAEDPNRRISRSGAHLSISTSLTYDVLHIGITITTLELLPQLTSTTMYDSLLFHFLRRSYERNSTIQFHIATLAIYSN